MKKFVCIHGHFYQPPRENPWLEEIEVQDSAYPYRDWNERITAECYNPNTAARILNGNNTVIEIINNYSKISFNFGPTLLSWMAAKAPDVYGAILNADKESMGYFSGHGSAIAQVYNHMIMPLSNKRDKETQAIWGIEDFKYRFGRMPEGIWLAETAVDTGTLEVIAEQGIKFTILAPRQAGKIKHFDSEEWQDVSGGTVDPRRAYVCNLPSGKKINLFFYDGNISQDLAFGNLMENGQNLADRMLGTLSDSDDAEIAHIATDGETYGHHQKHGDMALAYCLYLVDNNKDVDLTVYGEFLEKYPPQWEVQIVENTSWSCVHGVERWKSNCGCNSGRPGWNQEWRAPLRNALDWLRDEMIPYYEEEIKKFKCDPWKLRNSYIKIILDRTPENIDAVFAENGLKDVSTGDKVKLLKLLELQRHAMLMYTSCGWFFDELSGIETVQVILYAARVIQLAKEVSGKNYEPEFLNRLEQIKSNIPATPNGKVIYNNFVKPAIIDLLRLAAHYAVSSLFEEKTENTNIFCYEVFNEEFQKMEAGKQKMVIGRSRMRSQVTYEEDTISFAFFHFGDQNINGGVRPTRDENEFNLMRDEMAEAFRRLSIADIILLLDKHFHTHNYTIWHLFKDQSRNVFHKLLNETLENIEFSFRQIYRNHYPIMLAMKETGTPIPSEIINAVGYALNADIKQVLQNDEPIDADRLQNLSDEVKRWNLNLDKEGLSYAGSNRIVKLFDIWLEQPANIELMEEIDRSLRILNELGLSLNIWKAQNIFFFISKENLGSYKEKAENGKEEGDKWLKLFYSIEESLGVKVE